MMVHELKILPQFFRAVKDGIKTFELRRDDREYNDGDFLILREWDCVRYTGSSLCMRVNYILRNAEMFGLKDGYVILGIRKLNANDWLNDEE